ncbi:homeobox domain protein [Rhizoctonia solani AG-3 Rhs1AP]|uniref:Homeobox domain protein n=1 Tax=Rhizoctonia solani AG-3 Rhs1AP TaxID=1086054 RepID=X8JL51_9AGAM|nr:homeobox domain protein [Rhizoctonia solani AG-3 Rhs1AP]
MNDSPMLRALSAIQVTVHQHLALSQNQAIAQHAPSFDTRMAHSPLKSTMSELPSQLSSFGISAEVAAEINNALTAENHSYQASIAHSRQQLLNDISTTTVAADPRALPSLISAACQKFYNSTVDSCLDSVQKHINEYTRGDGPLSDPDDVSESEDNSSCQSDDDESDNDMQGQDAEEDDNAPMKAGEEVPPLETKYLPIFEALHERGKVLTKPEKTYLVNLTGMTYRQITIWFQNRRRGELKEDANRAYTSRPDSVHSFSSSDISDELNLEQTLSNTRTDTTFDICSWRLTSAFPTKDGIPGCSAPPSPMKLSFGPTITAIGSDTDDTDLSESGDEASVPPGLRNSSLSMSTTATSVSLESIQATYSATEPLIVSTTSSNAERVFTRPIKPIPNSRLNSSPQSTQLTQAQVSSGFQGGSAQPSLGPLIGSSLAPIPSPPHYESSVIFIYSSYSKSRWLASITFKYFCGLLPTTKCVSDPFGAFCFISSSSGQTPPSSYGVCASSSPPASSSPTFCRNPNYCPKLSASFCHTTSVKQSLTRQHDAGFLTTS